MTSPLVTIITVVFNGAKNLEQTIISVLDQDYDNIEYIVIDGGSTDGTIDILKKYDRQLAFWTSEKDNGIYDAMNKGVKKATGAIIGIINSDDFYFPHTISKIVTAYKTGKAAIIHGNQLIIKEYGNYCCFKVSKPDLTRIFNYPSIFHPTCFVDKQVYNKIGLFDDRLKVIADYDFLLRAVENQIDFIYIDEILTGFRTGGASGSLKGWHESFALKKKHPKLNITYLGIWIGITTRNLKRCISRMVGYDKVVIRRQRKNNIVRF